MKSARHRMIASAIACWLALFATSPGPLARAAAAGDSPTAAAAETPAAARTAAPATTRRHRAIFVCEDGGVPVYSDRPCAIASPSRAIVIETPGAGAAFVTSPPPPRASTRPAPARRAPQPAPNDARASRCETLQRQLGEVNSRMRAGYSAREAARLWQRWRGLKDRLHAARC
jgi:hypothetical protein